MPRIAIYARKSTESEDRQTASIESQLHWAVKRCAELGLGTPLIFTESRSAKTPGRPEFARMIALIEKREVQTVICWKADRLSRNHKEGGTLLWLLESRGLTIITSDRTYTAEPEAAFTLTIELGMSVKYSQDLAKNVRRGIEAKLRRGEWSFFAPIGYKNVRLSGDRATIAVDEELAPYIQRLFEFAANGTHSLSDLVRLTKESWKLQIPQRRSSSPRYGLSHTTIDRILRNPFYYGKLVVKTEEYEGAHTPLISKETFDRTQLMMKHRAKAAPRPKRNIFALSGLLWCGLCGRRLTGYRKQKRKSGQEYVYYVCSNRIRKRCKQPLVHETKVFSDLYRALFRMAVRPDEYEDAALVLHEMRGREKDAAKETATRAGTALRDVEVQQERLLNLLVEGVIARDDYERKRRELETARVERVLTIATASRAQDERFDRAGAFLQALQDADQTFERSTPEERRTLLRLLGLEFTAHGEEVLVEAQKPAAAVMGRREFHEWSSLWADIILFFGTEQSTEHAARQSTEHRAERGE